MGEPIDHLASFTAQLPFALDDFQLRGCRALAGGHSVLICAPTGAGKTIVGEFAVHLALSTGGKCFYTTPIKALSNQKFNDLTARYGSQSVGLLTGDQSINSHAPIVVMTTEVLRNMLYASSSTLDGLSHVVMDEVHYLADRMRGAVWEEVILHLSDNVRLANLSATVSNAEEFGAWIETVRGDTTIVVDEHRPVPLQQHVLVGTKLYDLFDDRRSGATPGSKVINEELLRTIRNRMHRDVVGYSRNGPRRARVGGRGNDRPSFTPQMSRPDMVARLEREALLPGICFIFSRAGCDAAAQQCVRSRLNLVAPEQLPLIDEIIERNTAELPDKDLEVLGFWQWRDGLRRGIASHHAGLLPAFRHTVEELFVKGFLRIVFATETLALGINMPARSVILEKLVKYNGENHVDLTPGEYTQLTGRAGRRGIDIEGHAVAVWQPNLDPRALAGLASTRTYPLRSSFRPGYNMTVNLLTHMTTDQARGLLERSFAQFQADKSVVGLVRAVDRNEVQLRELADLLGGSESSLLSYLKLREQIRQREKALRRDYQSDRKDAVTTSLAELQRGDVIAVRDRRHLKLAVVIDPARDDSSPRPVIITEDRSAGPIHASEFTDPVIAIGRIRLPKQLDQRSAKMRSDVASSLRQSGLSARRAPKARSAAADDRELASLRKQLTRHPEHKSADLEDKLALGEQYNRLRRDTDSSKQKIAAATNSLGRTFDRISSLLRELGYIGPAPESDELSVVVTDSGRQLSQLYAESDLLVAQCIVHETWEGLRPADLAASVSVVLYEARREEAEPRLESLPASVRNAIARTIEEWEVVSEAEVRHKLPVTRLPDAGLAAGIYLWANDSALSDVLFACGDRGIPLPAGDFVRWCRQVIDLLSQLAKLNDRPALQRTALQAIGKLRRGIVDAST